MRMKKLICLLLLAVVLTGCVEIVLIPQAPAVSLDAIPVWSGDAWIAIDNNIPGFTAEDLTTEPFEQYSPLDDLGRCGTAYACVARELMPTEDRESISSVTPSGWVNKKYDFIDGKYLYNRCHLIGFQLTGENANKRNLITGTRYLNIEGMLPFENMVADHVQEEDHHVLYRITPVYQEDALVCSGVQMEGYCVECGEAKFNEDKFMFHVYCYNVQPGVLIDYLTGESTVSEIGKDSEELDWVLNTSSKKFHTPDCSNAESISKKNRDEVTCTRDELIYRGYEPCGICKP